MKKFDFVAIGDITTDAFIKLKEADVHCKLDKETCELCVEFGAKVPYESVTVVPAVGNSPNAAVCSARLGLSSALVTNQGDDDVAESHMEALKNSGVALDFIRNHSDKKTNYHYVLWYGNERTILIKHEEYIYELPDIGEPSWLYVSSMGESALEFHDEIAEYLEQHPNIKLAFQPGTFQIKMGSDQLRKLYKRAEVFICNVEEAQKILQIENRSIPTLLSGMRQLGPKIVIITDDLKGAYLAERDAAWHMPIYPDQDPPYERTGAGDAYAATFVSALALGKTPLEAIRWAPINAMHVVQKIGAQDGLLSRQEIETFLAHAPDDFKPELIS